MISGWWWKGTTLISEGKLFGGSQQTTLTRDARPRQGRRVGVWVTWAFLDITLVYMKTSVYLIGGYMALGG
jgi:hypothetical protein